MQLAENSYSVVSDGAPLNIVNSQVAGTTTVRWFSAWSATSLLLIALAKLIHCV